ncbi:hypothetical protein [Modestobacter roseus]|nr:hypothetical protein [Modestobacter roseus]MQA33504.1 hypothetical protein [Modestobacter roseus]
MPNLVGREVRPPAPPAPGRPGGETMTGPLHAVAAEPGAAARESHEQVQALCGTWVRVVPVEDVPDDAGLCRACQYGP